MATYRKKQLRGETVWEVDLGYDLEGKRIKRIKRSEKEAEDELDAFEKAEKRRDAWWYMKTKKEKAIIHGVCIEIAQAGLTPSDVWAAYKEGQKETDSGKELTKIEFDKAVAEWKRLKKSTGDTEEYLDASERFFFQFAEGREKQDFHKFTFKDMENMEKANPKWSPGTKRGYRRLLSSLWELGMRQGWDNKNIIDRLEPLPRWKPNVQIYSNLETKRLLAGACQFEATRKVLPLFVLGAFGCMRPEEITEPPENRNSKPFGWWAIDLKHGRIPLTEDLTKTSEVRTIVMQETCRLWMEKCKEWGCEIPPENHRKLREQVCALVGVKWGKDKLRKTCATHLRGLMKNDYRVIEQCGNKIRILLSHYAKMNIPEEVSMDYWENLTPEDIEEYMKSDEWKQLISVSGANPAR